MRYEGSILRPVTAAPALGEHTDVLLESLCGVEPDETKRLRQEGVV